MTYGAGPAGPHAVTATSDGLTMTYDANGNMREKRPASCPAAPAPCPEAKTFHYDAENRLVEVESPRQRTVSVTFQEGWNFFSVPVVPS